MAGPGARVRNPITVGKAVCRTRRAGGRDAETVRTFFLHRNDALKCADALGRLVQVQREHGTREEVRGVLLTHS